MSVPSFKLIINKRHPQQQQSHRLPTIIIEVVGTVCTVPLWDTMTKSTELHMVQVDGNHDVVAELAIDSTAAIDTFIPVKPD